MPQNTSSSSIFGRLSTSTRSSFMSPKDVRCNVHLLHDSDIIANEFPKNKPAQTILDYVCELKKIDERDFLGLRYQDHNKHRYWLDLSRSIGHVIKQFRTESLSLHLRFRYYPSDPTRIRDPNLRYQLFVQLQRDLLHGRMYCPQTQSAELAALILQAQLGDYNETEHPPNYVSGYKLLLRQTPKLEERIEALHKNMKGKTRDEAELEFLEKASQLDTYAFDPYTIKDPLEPTNAVYLGASDKGILIYTGTSKAHHIDWSELTKVDYSGRELVITVNESYRPPVNVSTTSPTGTIDGHSNGHALNSPISSATEKHSPKKGTLTLKYLCPSGKFAKHLWIHILSQQAFFNEESADCVKLKFSKPRIPLLSRGSTFRFPSRRVYREIEEGLSSGNESTMARSMFETNGHLSHAQAGTDDESAFNTSTASVPVARYELPRQEMRAEQPWLNKTSNSAIKTPNTETAVEKDNSNSDKENNNNVKFKPANLNVALTDTENILKHDQTPSTSEELPEPTYITTAKVADQNSASFTVHLVKREDSRSHSPTGLLEENKQDYLKLIEKQFNENVQSDESPGQPLASSTPRATKTHFEQNGKVADGEKKNEKKEPANNVAFNESVIVKKSMISRLMNASFVLFLMLLLTLAFIICIFERSEGANSDWVENQKILSELRHVYYEPARHYVVDQYRRRFGGK